MGLSKRESLQCFDPRQSYSVKWRKLPHWAQAGTAVFITWRTVDSFPRDLVERWLRERDTVLQRHGITPPCDTEKDPARWKRDIDPLPSVEQWSVRQALTLRWDGCLDECRGACVLKEHSLSRIVGESLLKFDGDRYVLTDYVVMPNHVHLLAAFPDEEGMLKQCSNWKRYTARKINGALKRSGEFWHEDAFDHLVRSPEQFDHYRRYIASNGPAAGLAAHEFLWYSNGGVDC